MRRKRRRTVLGLIGGFGLATALAGAGAWAAGLRWNGTPSYPRGLWRIVAPYDPAHGRGSIVLFCAPDSPLMRTARERGYLRAGLCPGGAGALLKRVVAVPGDRVTATPKGVSVNDVELPNSRPLPADTHGRPLPRARGALLSAGQVWVMSEYSPRSFDSRYYGPIETARIKGVVRPVFVWEP
jgi:conjugative transfer signal peptidase TraF